MLNPSGGGTAGPVISTTPSMIPTGVVGEATHETEGGSDKSPTDTTNSDPTPPPPSPSPPPPPPPSGATPASPSDAPIVVSGTPLGNTPNASARCPSPDLKYFFDSFQMGWTGNYDKEGRWEIVTKQRLLEQEGKGPANGYSGDTVQVLDAAFPSPPSGTSTTEQEGCVFAVIYFPPNRVNRDVIFSYQETAKDSLSCTLPPPFQSKVTIPDQPPTTAVSHCDGSPYHSPLNQLKIRHDLDKISPSSVMQNEP